MLGIYRYKINVIVPVLLSTGLMTTLLSIISKIFLCTWCIGYFDF